MELAGRSFQFGSLLTDDHLAWIWENDRHPASFICHARPKTQAKVFSSSSSL
jgi:hypothetical protein